MTKTTLLHEGDLVKNANGLSLVTIRDDTPGEVAHTTVYRDVAERTGLPLAHPAVRLAEISTPTPKHLARIRDILRYSQAGPVRTVAEREDSDELLTEIFAAFAGTYLDART